MRDKYVISDLHLGHENCITKFKRPDGTPLRNFKDVEEMNETIINNINSVVRPQDSLYILGDCVINKKFLPLLARLNGHKRLIHGNHDIEPTKEFLKYFEEIYGVRTFAHDLIMSHIPIHRESMARWNVNLHGHLHFGEVMYKREHNGVSVPDPMYLNMSVEMLDYKPISLEEARDRARKNREKYPELVYKPDYSGAV